LAAELARTRWESSQRSPKPFNGIGKGKERRRGGSGTEGEGRKGHRREG